MTISVVDVVFQFVIGTDGVCGVIPEHSPFEVIVVVQCAEHVLKDMCVKSDEHIKHEQELRRICLIIPCEGTSISLCCRRSGSGKASPGLKSSERPRPCRLVWRCSADVHEMLDSAADHLQR